MESGAEHSPARVAAARAFAASARRGLPQVEGPQRTSRENDEFVPEFFAASRLHFIGSWKSRFQNLLDSLPPPPPLSAPRPGCERVIFHVDMDCFFASVATLNRPVLRGLPVGVSWSSHTTSGAAEIASANYEARAFGVKNGMFVRTAMQLCPDLVLMPYEFEAYERIADAMYKLVFEATPHVMGVSVDECYCDLTHAPGEPEQLAASLRAAIAAGTGCNASIGIGPNRLLARLATKRAKPDGLVRIHSVAEGAAELRDVPIGELPGVGRKHAASIAAMDVHTCGELRECEPSRLRAVLGPRTSETLRAFAAGKDSRAWEARPPRQTVGAQSSWGVRFRTAAEAEGFATKLSTEVAARLGALKLKGRQVTLKVWVAVKDAPAWKAKGAMGHGVCDHLSRSATLASATRQPELLASEAVRLVREAAVPAAELRGMGVSVGKLQHDGGAAPRADGGGGGGRIAEFFCGGRGDGSPSGVKRSPLRIDGAGSGDSARWKQPRAAVQGDHSPEVSPWPPAMHGDAPEPTPLDEPLSADGDDGEAEAIRAAVAPMFEQLQLVYAACILPELPPLAGEAPGPCSAAAADDLADAALAPTAALLERMCALLIRAAGGRSAGRGAAGELLQRARRLAYTSLGAVAADSSAVGSGRLDRWLEACDRLEDFARRLAEELRPPVEV